jgi:UDP-N-acetylmuramoylalanine--D-glutamate ligase
MQPSDVAVVELSSWQLELVNEQCPAPDVAVVTNLYPDHLNTYVGMKEYGAAKQNIFAFQTPKQLVVINRDNQATRAMGALARGQRWWFSAKAFDEENGGFVRDGWLCVRTNGTIKKIIATKKLSLPGEHNQSNTLAAATVAVALGVPVSSISSALRRMVGLPGRLQTIRVVRGVPYINDTTATSPDGTIAALRALAKKYSTTVLIAGGASKHLPDADYLRLAREVKKHHVRIILFAGAGSDQLRTQLKKIGISPVADYLTRMVDAVGIAKALALKGGCVVLSPGCASFGLFINEFDRGDQFNAVVRLV